VSGTDPLGLVPAIRARLVASFTYPDPRDEALLAVLELEPPPFHEGDDRDLHDLLVGGWQTCHRAVLHAIARELEVPGA
jgi:hypothetical protein